MLCKWCQIANLFGKYKKKSRLYCSDVERIVSGDFDGPWSSYNPQLPNKCLEQCTSYSKYWFKSSPHYFFLYRNLELPLSLHSIKLMKKYISAENSAEFSDKEDLKKTYLPKQILMDKSSFVWKHMILESLLTSLKLYLLPIYCFSLASYFV